MNFYIQNFQKKKLLEAKKLEWKAATVECEWNRICAVLEKIINRLFLNEKETFNYCYD